GPAVTEPGRKGAGLHAQAEGPVGEDERQAVVVEEVVTPPVTRLRAWVRPFDVPGHVVPVVVEPVQAGTPEGLGAQVGEEVGEAVGFQPAVADADAPAAVPAVLAAVGVVAALDGAGPDLVLARAPPALEEAVIARALGVSDHRSAVRGSGRSYRLSGGRPWPSRPIIGEKAEYCKSGGSHLTSLLHDSLHRST